MRILNRTNLVYSLFLAIIWMLMTDAISTGGELFHLDGLTLHLLGIQFAVDGFIVGYILSCVVVVMLLTVQPEAERIKFPLPRLHRIFLYIAKLNWEVLLSSKNMIGWILRPDTIRSGIIAVPLHDPDDSPIVAAMTAHNITVTMGQSVVTYDSIRKILYVHCLDIDVMALTIDDEQKGRVRAARKVLGLD